MLHEMYIGLHVLLTTSPSLHNSAMMLTSVVLFFFFLVQYKTGSPPYKYILPS